MQVMSTNMVNYLTYTLCFSPNNFLMFDIKKEKFIFNFCDSAINPTSASFMLYRLVTTTA